MPKPRSGQSDESFETNGNGSVLYGYGDELALASVLEIVLRRRRVPPSRSWPVVGLERVAATGGGFKPGDRVLTGSGARW